MSNNSSSNITALPLDEEVALIREAQAGSEHAKDCLLTAYAPAIRNATRRYRDHVEADDLEQEAALAFLEIIETHDPEKGQRLAGRVAMMLTKALDGAASLASSGWNIPPRTLQRFHSILRKAEGDAVAGAALAPTYEMPAATFTHIFNLLRGTGSLSEPTSEGEKHSHTDAGISVVTTPRDQFADADDQMMVDAAFRAVTEDQTKIIRLAYGFDHVEVAGATIPPTVSDSLVAEAMPTPNENDRPWTRPTIQRQRTAALKSMRGALGLNNNTEKEQN